MVIICCFPGYLIQKHIQQAVNRSLIRYILVKVLSDYMGSSRLPIINKG